jgi:hypothetical protein
MKKITHVQGSRYTIEVHGTIAELELYAEHYGLLGYHVDIDAGKLTATKDYSSFNPSWPWPMQCNWRRKHD